MKKKKYVLKKKSTEEECAANRRKFLAALDPKVRKFAKREFAKLGLYQ